MVNILAFPGKSSSKVTYQGAPDCAPSAALVGSTLDGTLVVARATSICLTGDWSNQELADLYRVEALLVQAGIRVSTERGLTDEHEPWFVFCRDDGEVFVHLARIGGDYLLDSSGLGIPLEGSDFTSLIDRFVQQVAARSEPDNNVVSFRPRMLHGQTVRLHPAVMLAALVWTLYLASDDLMGAAEAAEILAADGGYIPNTIMDHGAALGLEPDLALEPNLALSDLPTQNTQTGPQAASSQTPSASDRQLVSSQESLRGHQSLDGRGGLGGTFSNAAITPQAVAASLAVIAFGYGFNNTYSLSELSNINTEKAAADLHLILTQLADKATSIVVAQADGSPIGLTDGSPIELVVNAADKIAPPDTVINSLLRSDAPLSSNTNEETDAPINESGKPEAAIVKEVDRVSTEGAGQTVPMAVEEKAPAAVPVAVLTAPISLSDAENLIKFVSEYSGPITKYLVDGVTVSATLDQQNLDKVLLQINEVGSDPILGDDQKSGPDSTLVLSVTAPQSKAVPSWTFANYDDQAKKFVHDFIVDSGSLEVLQVDNDLMLIDMTALDEPTDHAFVRSWVTDDGYVISTIGHYHVFLDFGLV